MYLGIPRPQAIARKYGTSFTAQCQVQEPSQSPTNSQVTTKTYQPGPTKKLPKWDFSLRLASGNYAACGFQILLQRKHQPLIYQVSTINIKKRKTITMMFQIYIPCCLFVSVSWISFVIDPKVRFGDFPPL